MTSEPAAAAFKQLTVIGAPAAWMQYLLLPPSNSCCDMCLDNFCCFAITCGSWASERDDDRHVAPQKAGERTATVPLVVSSCSDVL